MKAVGREFAGGGVRGRQGGAELRLPVGGGSDQGARLTAARGGIVNEFLRNQVVVFRFGTEHCGNRDRIGLRAGLALDFTDKVFRDGDLACHERSRRVVTEIGFVGGVAVDAIGRFGVGRAAKALRAFGLRRSFRDVGQRRILGGDQHDFICDDFIEIGQPFENGRALLWRKRRGCFELGAHALRPIQRGAPGGL